MTHDGHVAEYKAAVAALDLEVPPGVVRPKEPPPETEPGTLYFTGTGEVAALLAWLNAVETTALAAHLDGDQAEAQRWVGVAAQFVETDTFTKVNDPDVPISWFDAVIVPARRGGLRCARG